MKSNEMYTFILESHDKEGLQLVDLTTGQMHLLWNLGAEYSGSQSGVPGSEHLLGKANFTELETLGVGSRIPCL